MQEARRRHCPQHHRHHSHLCGQGGGRGLCDLAREFQKSADSYEDDDADEHHPCDCLFAQMRGLAWLWEGG